MINITAVEKSYGKSDSLVTALKKVDVQIERGEMVAIVGASGSGKSTLLNIIGCLDKATSGQYLFDGTNVQDLNQRALAKLRNKGFGFVVQYFALIDDYTVYENIEIPLKYGKVNKKLREQKIEALLEKLQIADKRNKTPKELSGGQCQRVAIARALVNDPDIILADEPTGALDKKTGEEVVEIFRSLNEEGKTIVIVTHDEKVARSCNRIITIEDGMICKNEIISRG
ncbi:ABC transporter ATP-binding protein [Clostridium zeae]|uniref:ABC transporter ATP-binding protein n=1 Tax=Clostridium zeae TaxID=2759022 RepID=A0ABQ1E6R6_9CLOT|nr:ABC transporter ATP-binding protein [Clostridium zeae]GFZ30433.1 ABC transporter ATP-binding protein [Clostridium zeae]